MSELTIAEAEPSRTPPRTAEFLLRGAGLFYSATLVALVGRLIIAFVIAQALGAAALGIYSLGYATVQALSTLSTLGQGSGLVHFVSPAFRHQEWATVRGMLDAAVAMGALWATLSALAMVVFFPFYLQSSIGAEAAHLAPWFALAILPEVLESLVASFGLACGRPSAAALPDRIGGTLVQVVVTLITLWWGWGLFGVVIGFVANSVVSLVIAVIMVWDLYPRHIVRTPLAATAKKLFSYSWKVGLSNAANYALLNAALFVLGYYNAAQAGIYAAASRLTYPGSLFLESFGQSFAPHAAAHLHEPALNADYQRVTNWMICASAPVFVLLFAFSGTWIGLLGPEFAGGASVLIVMSLAQLMDIAVGPSGATLTVAHRPGVKILNTVIVWGTNLVLVLLLTPQWGALGAAYAFFAAIFITDVLEYTEVYFLLRIRAWSTLLVKPALIIFGLGAILTLVSYIFHPALWAVILLS
jgi:O-antigen/teichoic acid export membrane protein